MPKKLTDRQRKIFEFIRSTIEKQGYPPTFRDIGTAFGIKSTNGVRVQLNAIEKKGYIKRHSRLSRGLEVVGQPVINFVPLMESKVAAGSPLLAEDRVDEMVGIDNSMLPGDYSFALKVKGDSMIGAGIFDGDIVFVRQQRDAEPGEIVVALIGEEATVKKYYPERGRIRFEPANPAHRAIIVEEGTPGVGIIGKVVGLVRRM